MFLNLNHSISHPLLENKMPVDLYQLSDKFLHRSSYWIDLTESVIAAAYPEKILVGLTEDQFGTEDTPDAIKFSTRGVCLLYTSPSPRDRG